ncbi:restriction endonuclease subunit S [Actibacterium sp.]|uniref:restriction endonuclease subunit S n=1 Tax=Actibacterium sp. TaxID=1872125 RepID=UPI00257A07D7|nr:restriction endonuclease subunit S [Actibacterium sp.]
MAPVEMTGKDEPDREIWYVDISSIDNQTNRITEPKRLQLSEAPSRARQKIVVGDVLFSTVRPYLRKIAAVDAKYDGEIASTGFAVLRGATGIDPKYVFFKAISHDFVSALTGEQYGVSYPAVKEEQVRAQPLELPPSNEQRRIVEKIEAMFDEIDKGVESLQTARTTLGLYRQSLLKSAFEGRLTTDWRALNADKLEAPETLLAHLDDDRDAWHEREFQRWQDDVAAWENNGSKGPKPRKPEAYKSSDALTDVERAVLPKTPSEWVFARLNDIAHIGSGMSVSKARKLEDPVETPYLRVANVQRGHLDLAEIKTMPVEKSQLSALCLRTWDILFNEGGDRDKLGRGWIWEDQVEICITQNHVFRATPFRHDKGWSAFVSQWGNSYGRDYFEAGGKQTTNLASINKTVLKALPVPICSPAEQTELILRLDARLEAADAMEAEIEAALTRANALRQSILKKAFSGQLVPQDPEDEPASVLLARIKAEKEGREKAEKEARESRPARIAEPRRPTLTDLLDVLKQQKSWIPASKAAEGLGLGDGASSDDIEAFYHQLKQHVESSAIEVERRGDEDWLRLAEVEAN